MNSFKKLTAVFLAVLMIASLAVIGVYADETPSAASTSLKVTSSSSLGGEPVSKTFDTANDTTVTVKYAMTVTQAFANIQGFVSYDDSVLEVKKVTFDNGLSDAVYNTDLADKLTFNDTHDENSIDYTTETTFLTVTFNILATSGETAVALNVEELNSLTVEYATDAIISDGAIVKADAVAGSAYVDDPVPPTEPTQPTQPAPETKVSLKISSAKIYVGAKTTAKATVDNPAGATVYTSGNTKVATVDAKGNVTGKGAGSTTITATNNGKSASVKITVVKKANTIKVTAKKLTVKATAKKTTFKKAKAFKITGAKGKVTFKKKSGSKLISVSNTGTVTVKSGIKKGKTASVKVTVTAAGTAAYNKGAKTVTLTVKAK